mgnify:CR=1 FL=1|jgi:hypothetical protein
MAHLNLKKDAFNLTQTGSTIQNLLNVVQSFETNELEELRGLINVIKDIDTNDDNADFKQQLINAINNAVMENEVVDTLDKDSTYPPQATTVRKALNGITDKIAQIVKNVQDETQERQNNDSSLNTLISTETSERKSDVQSINETLSSKADKTTLYGTGISTHTITHSLEKADLIISINTSYGNGYVTIDGETVKNKILMDGLTIQSESISATFSAEKGEEGEKYINLLYSTETGKLDLEVTEQPEPGNFAKMDVTYMKATISEMYARRMYFDGLNTLTSLATKNKNSFLEAINELVASDTSINNSIGTIKKQLENTTTTGIWHYGTLLTHTTNVNDVANNDISANVGDFYLNSNTFSVYFCVGDNKGNHNWLYIGNLAGSFDYSNYASINSPNFTGTPTAPTPSVLNNSRQVATTEYVRSAIDKYASGNGLEMIDLVERLRDDVYGKQIVWTAGGNIMNLTLPVPKIVDVNSEKVSITFDKGIIPFSNNDMGLWNLPLSATTVEFIPVSRNKTYINCEFNIDTQAFTLTTSDSAILDNVFENRIWKFTICYYTISVVYNDSSEEPPSQFVISNYDCDWMGNKFSITSPYQTLRNLSTDDKTSLICATNEIKKQAVETENNVGEIIYALHPDITTIKINGNSVVQNSYYGELITTDVNEIFVLDNQFDDFYSDYDKYDRVHKGHFLYTNDEVGYRPTKDILENKKAFCRILSKPSTGADSMDGEIEVLLTF